MASLGTELVALVESHAKSEIEGKVDTITSTLFCVLLPYTTFCLLANLSYDRPIFLSLQRVHVLNPHGTRRPAYSPALNSQLAAVPRWSPLS